MALHRYRIQRGRRPDDDPLPDGRRQDTRKHTQHCLRPPAAAVARYLGLGTDGAWREFRREYRRNLEKRFAEDRGAFDALAARARIEDVYLGCSCPTQRNPDVRRCHTVLALEFMGARYVDLEVVFPVGLEPDA